MVAAVTRLGPLRMLDRKALRDIWHMRGVAVAIVLVMASGIASFVAMRSMVPHLVDAQEAYYRNARFGDLWVNVKRAPLSIAREIKDIPGIAAVETRVTGEVIVDIPGLQEPATAHIVGVPTARPMTVDLLTIRSGRSIAGHGRDEAVISEGFATGNKLGPGDSIGAVINGNWRQLHVVGIALSPQFITEMRPGEFIPDNRRYGIIWIDEENAAAAFGMQDAWNEASIALTKGTSEKQVILALDHLLARYGTLGAHGRDQQLSHRFLTQEIGQARAFAAIAPLIFLGVAAFLLNIVLTRIVASQREQIGMLKAFGATEWEVGRHFAIIALGPVLAGAFIGTVGGLWFATFLARMYATFYHIPNSPFEIRYSIIAAAIGISVLAALTGAIGAVRRVLQLPAAQALRTEPPAQYHAGFAERLHIDRLLSVVGRMILRAIERRPLRALLAVVGMSLGIAVMLIGGFMFDAIRSLRDVQFEHAQLEDIAVNFTAPRGSNALQELAHLPGVTRVEPLRGAAVRVSREHWSRQVGIVAVDDHAQLRRVVDASGNNATVPAKGLLVSRALAALLHVHAGDTVHVELLTGQRRSRDMVIGGLLDDLLGTNAYLPTDELLRFTGEGEAIDGAVLAVNAVWHDAVYNRVKRMPGIAGVESRAALLANFDKTMDDNMNVTLYTMLFFAMALSAGVVYNTARVGLSERGRELASLRVLGFTRGEVAGMLFGEQAILGVIAIPVGFVIGTFLCWIMTTGFSSELFRFPFVITPRTYLFSALMFASVAIASAVLVRRRLDELDLIEVLKTRE